MPRAARSSLEVSLDYAIAQLYPHDPVKHEMPIKVRGKTLYVDRVIQAHRIAIEVDGRQHGEFVQHMHRDAQGFADSKTRDRLKQQWLEENGYTVVRFSHSEKITPATLRSKILKAMK